MSTTTQLVRMPRISTTHTQESCIYCDVAVERALRTWGEEKHENTVTTTVAGEHVATLTREG